jgi:hypothetical protein
MEGYPVGPETIGEEVITSYLIVDIPLVEFDEVLLFLQPTVRMTDSAIIKNELILLFMFF